MTYSVDFRQQVLSVKSEEGLSFAKAAARFCIGINSVVRWSQRLKPHCHRTKPATKLDMEKLKEDSVLYPDASHYERAERLGVSANGIWHALRRLKVTYKKNPQASQSRPRKTLCFLSSCTRVS